MPAKKIKKVILSIVCLIFTLSLFVLYFNIHFHIINENFLITHSHPFDKDHSSKFPFQSHHHSPLEFLIYATLINVSGIILFSGFLINLPILIDFLPNLPVFFWHLSPAFLFPTLRAPPLSNFIIKSCLNLS